MSADSPGLTDDQIAAVGIPQRVVAAWAQHDHDAFADLFTADATMILPGDVFVQQRENIRSYMAEAYSAAFKGTRVTGVPLSVRFLGPETAVLVTEGGVLAPGEEEVAAERAIRATWVLTRRDGGWLIAAYQNTPIQAS